MDVGQGDPSLFFKASWNHRPASHQRPAQGTCFFTARPEGQLPIVPRGCDKDQARE